MGDFTQLLIDGAVNSDIVPLIDTRRRNQMNVQQNIKAAAEGTAALRAHPMAARVVEDRTHILVTYPAGFRIGGVRVTLANGVAWACGQALIRMEREWVESYPNRRPPQ